ncbi:protein arginine N-methyltransferase 9-like isoform X1 [Amphibalanus amphitrite]|uniref:protein arginine N-methyltransferase 9-like isoform X1 n=1 Tax=Amphibalanus amphitrite TaxID=1232801 RepID=UPI001C922DD2|nr:protein arginine N-methyltransferase 9-like isoform X1 [Amphibalanus amphitrite]XP_043229695.1 protein arginine N-methyltransferase 9-like isoform X1 [Amphibalanus amphitrite]XP_043229696.1 protein arginine N-methyltransferase 9-like isoform X1 [Amphibalanus amphitrite]XP_043229697.1 protein arginine N-methyltransferase 9-like isoform X1 [Amphibalanus amphitrite]
MWLCSVTSPSKALKNILHCSSRHLVHQAETPSPARPVSRHGHVLQAAAQFLRAARADGSLVAARDGLERANSQLVDRWHFTMLNDARRNAAYGRAVRAASRRLAEGELVLDLGAGTGLLSMLAAQAGASPVVACESSEAMCQVAAATLADNGMENRVQLVNKWSHELTVGKDLPCRASLLVTETFDAGLLGEHILSTLQHAWRHLLLPPGRGCVLPASAAVWAAAVESAEVRSQLSAHLPSGEQLRRRLTEPYWSERLEDAPGGYRLLSEPVQVYSVDFNDPDDIERGLSGVEGRHVVQCTADGRLDALVTWFELQLGEGEVLSSAPGEETCWEQAVYAVPTGRVVCAEQNLAIRSVCKGHLELRLEDSSTEGATLGNGTGEMDENHAPESNQPKMDTEAAQMHQVQTPASATASDVSKPSEAADDVHLAGDDVTTSTDPEEVTSEALAFVGNSHHLNTIKSYLHRWMAARPPSSPHPHLLDLCPIPLARLIDLSGVNVSRMDSESAEVTSESVRQCQSLAGEQRSGSVARGPSDGKDRRTDGSWDCVLSAPVLPSGRLDPAVLRMVQSVSLRPGGLLWPSRLQLLAVAVSSRLLLNMSAVQPENTESLDCSAINVFAVTQQQDFPYRQRSVSSDLSDIHVIGCLDLTSGTMDPPRFSIPVTSTGELHGLVYWFRPVDDSAVGAARPECGRQMAAALQTPRTVQPGDEVCGTVHPTADGVIVMLEE